MICPVCQFSNPPSAAFCRQCRSALGPFGPDPQNLPSRIAERRQLTVMFCDMVGSTALSGRLDPEELYELTREYQIVCTEAITREGGYVAQYLGDGLLAYFGYPAAHEDDAVRAARAGLGIVAAVSKLQKSLHVRVGIHTGLAVVEQSQGQSDSPNITITGETPNITSRLQAIAESDTVVISEATHRLIEGFFVCRSLGKPSLKGVARPFELFLVLDESGVQSRFDRAVLTGLTPFVSREKELELLLQSWEHACAGHGQVVLLSGEPGIGKSRLMRVLKERTTIAGIAELGIRCSQYYQDSALYPVITFLQRLFQFQRNDDTAAQFDKLEKTLQAPGLDLFENVPLFADLLSLPGSKRYPSLGLSPEKQRQRTCEAIIDWLLKVAEQTPTRIIVEDAQWSDPSTLELISQLIERIPRARLFLAMVFRSDFVLPWRSQPHIQALNLGRLSKSATESMTRSIARGKLLPGDVLAEIGAKTEGVPLFVEELTRMILESGKLRELSDRYESIGSLPSLTIPSTIYESLMARLDRLGTAKEVAQLAATIGKEFSYELLHIVSPLDEAKLTGALNKLVDAELLEQRLRPPRTYYSFRHALIRDAAYESLLRSRRRQYHGDIARALEKHFPETIESQPELLAHHFAEAGLIEQAVPLFQRAGQRAFQRSESQEAIRHLKKGLALVRALPETTQQMQEELLLLTSLGPALSATKGFAFDEIETVYASARKLCQRLDASPQVFPVLWGLWLFYLARAQHDTAHELAQECLGMANLSGDKVHLLAAHHALGVSQLNYGNFAAALVHLDQGLGLYEDRQQNSLAFTFGQDPRVVCISHAAWALWFLGYPEQALKKTREALALAQKLSHPFSSAAAAAFASWFFQLCRSPYGAYEQAASAVALSVEREFAFWRGMGTILQGWAITEQSRVHEGTTQIGQGLTTLKTAGVEIMMPYFLALQAEALGKCGQTEEGLHRLSEAQAAADATAERWWQAEIHRVRGELLLHHVGAPELKAPERDEVEDCFRRALAIARAQGAKSLELRAAMSLNRMPQAKNSDTRKTLEDIYNWFSEGFDTADLKEAKTLLEQN
jgi:class 3 adenylate cyclase/predicted ATPase